MYAPPASRESGKSLLIQYVLLYVLGFLSALLLALLIAPALWRRAVRLTRRRLESTLPMTMAEITADKDAARAEYAAAVRRLEISLKASQDKVLSQSIEISRQHEELKLLEIERNEKAEALRSLAAREDELRLAGESLAKSRADLETRAAEIEELAARFEDASYTSSNRQIELVARESEIEKLVADVATLRKARNEFEQQVKALEQDNKAVREALVLEKRRLAEAEQKLERMRADLSDAQERLERRDRELTRLRPAESGTGDAVVEDDEADDTPGGDDRSRLEGRLTRLLRENRKIRMELAAQKDDAALGDDGALREEMHQLAAQVVAMTARLEGEGSPIDAALAGPAPGGEGASMQSLADRIRALRGLPA